MFNHGRHPVPLSSILHPLLSIEFRYKYFSCTCILLDIHVLACAINGVVMVVLWVCSICPCRCCLMFWHLRMTLVSGEGGRQWLAFQLEQVSYMVIPCSQGTCVCVCGMFILCPGSSLEVLFSPGGFLVSNGGGD